MADSSGCHVHPDNTLLQAIFPGVRPEIISVSVFIQTPGKCVFKAEFSAQLQLHRPPVVVRIEHSTEADTKSFAVIAALQKIAAKILPELVPETHQVGKARNKDGVEVQYSVVSLVEGQTLDEVWQQLTPENQLSLVVELAEAMRKLHSVRPCDNWVMESLLPAIFKPQNEHWQNVKQPILFGGPQTGFLDDGFDLLTAIVDNYKLEQPYCKWRRMWKSQDAALTSNYSRERFLAIDAEIMDQWPVEAVLCHNDPTPHNLIVRAEEASTGEKKYKLAGIIDWEMAGFYPASYELFKQDTHFCVANRHVSYYLLLKDHLGKLVPRNRSHHVLLKAMDMIFSAQQKVLRDNGDVSANIRRRFCETMSLVRDPDLYVGWIMSRGASACEEYSREAYQSLVEDVAKELSIQQKKWE